MHRPCGTPSIVLSHRQTLSKYSYKSSYSVTMLMRLLTLAAAASAATIKIQVGQGGLTFTPDSVTAAAGDTVEFYFVGGTHDAVAGDYSKPCEPSGTGFSSGVQAGATTGVRHPKITNTGEYDTG